jgi:hypothetical protein
MTCSCKINSISISINRFSDINNNIILTFVESLVAVALILTIITISLFIATTTIIYYYFCYYFANITNRI